MHIKKYREISPAPFDPAIWIERRFNRPAATARLICELAGLRRPDYHIGAPLKKAVR